MHSCCYISLRSQSNKVNSAHFPHFDGMPRPNHAPNSQSPPTIYSHCRAEAMSCAPIPTDEELVVAVGAGGGGEGRVEEEVVVVLRRPLPGAALAVGLLGASPCGRNSRSTVSRRDPIAGAISLSTAAAAAAAGDEVEGKEKWGKSAGRCPARRGFQNFFFLPRWRGRKGKP